MSWWSLARKEEYIFEYVFWISDHLNIKLDQLIDTVNIWAIFSGKNWDDLEIWVLDPAPFQIYQPTTINQKPITMSLYFFTFLRVYTETIKKWKDH